MTLYTAENISQLLEQIRNRQISQVYLLTGERFLCQQAAQKLCQALVADGGTIQSLDGERESIATILYKLTSYSLFGGRQVFRILDTRLFHSRKVAQSLWNRVMQARQNDDPGKAAGYLRAMLVSAGLTDDDLENDPGLIGAGQWQKLFGFAKPAEDLSWTAGLLEGNTATSASSSHPQTEDPAALLEQALEKGLPPQNILLLTSEDVDRRKRLYKLLEKHHVIIDLGVETGSSKRAQTAQKKVLLELIRSTLQGFGKTMQPAAADLLMERVGFSPVAVVMETEKMALYAGPAKQITTEDLNQIVGRTRQEALYELTEALGRRELEKALLIADRLAENNIHPLAIVATLKNYVRNLLLIRVLLEQPEIGYDRTVSASIFQQQILPRLKEKKEWQKELSGHPYALYMQCKTAFDFSPAVLRQWLEFILQADYRLKGSPVAPEILIHHLLLSMLGQKQWNLAKKTRSITI